MIIQFQGICFFRNVPRESSKSKADDVEVYLPLGDGHEHHLDGSKANPHHARIFVGKAFGVRTSGAFQPCSWRDKKGKVTAGYAFPLSHGGAGGYEVHVLGQADGSGIESTLATEIVSFAKFTDAKDRLDINHDAVAGVVSLRSGKLEFAISKFDWEISKKLQNDNKDEPLDTPVWKVEWTPTFRSTDDVEIVITKDSKPVAQAILPASNAPTVIIGNLDHPNPATWPSRGEDPIDGCEDANGDVITGSGVCYDNDFKWFYRLLPGSVEHAKGDFPVPRLDIVSAQKGKAKRGKKGAEKVPTAPGTPTCFGATD